MENLNMALLSSPSSSSSNWLLRNPDKPFLIFPNSNYKIAPRSSRRFLVASASRRTSRNGKVSGLRCFASVSSGEQMQTASVGVNPRPIPPPSSTIGSPLFWVGVGVGLSAVFSWVASYLKKYAMQQAMKTMMNQMNAQNNQFSNSPFSPGSPFPFPTPPLTGSPSSPSPPPFSSPGPAASQSSVASKPAVTVDVPASKVESTPAVDVKEEKETKSEPNKYAFVDVSPDETLLNSPFKDVEDTSKTSTSKEADFAKEGSSNGSASTQDPSSQGPFAGSQFTGKVGPGLSVEALEKMMEDPTVQKMVYPYLPEEMRNPTTFKWMLQNPQYRQQLQDMLNNMGGSNEWDSRMMDSLKNFDLSSPEVKQQFDQIGLTPEEVISKIMANPEVAMAFQNPKIQQAIMECSQNPLSITKYQNDKEVMDVFNKISELFPGVTGPP